LQPPSGAPGLADTAALAELVNRAYLVERSFLDGDRTSTDEIAELIASGCFVVLEYAGGLCGAVLVQGPGQRAGMPPSHAYLGMLSVLPEMQGKGSGSGWSAWQKRWPRRAARRR